MISRVVVIGGAGYIGSHIVRALAKARDAQTGKARFEVVVIDAFLGCNGRDRIASLPHSIALETGDIRDAVFLDAVFSKHRPSAVVHMAGSIVVPESVRDPLSYFDNNVIGAIRLAQAMRNHGVKHLVFSSTAALFGTPITDAHSLLSPDAPIHPDSPYGDSKAMTETIFRACDVAHEIKTVNLRFFNACGADPAGDIGEVHDPETHLIPIVLQVALGKRSHISLFGTDYPTPDGTCVRDYVHVNDLASAHIAALDYLAVGGASVSLNLGTGHGYSVKQVVDAARLVTGHLIPAVECPRRPGDPPRLVASAAKAKEVLGWSATCSDLDTIIRTAWKFHSAHPAGYSVRGPREGGE